MYKLCGKCEWHTDKCKNPDNVNYNDFRNKFDVCSNKKIPWNKREPKCKEREWKDYLKHGDDDL